MDEPRVNRREVLVAGVAAGAGLALQRSSLARADVARELDFSSAGTGDGWPGWACGGAANLRREGGRGLLEAGSDVFPNDPRPVAFAADQRFLDGEIHATLSATGAGAGVVLRRVGSRAYYAAIVDSEQHALVLLCRSGDEIRELARAPWAPAGGDVELSLRARGGGPTELVATAGLVTVSAVDAEPALQKPGDPGVLATARTLFPSDGPPPVASLGNVHLLPYGVQEGEAFMNSAVGQEVLDQIRERSTAVFKRISVRPSNGRVQSTPASVVAATSGMPRRAGGQVRVASDLPARIEVEFALNKRFRRSRFLRAGQTGAFDGFFSELREMPYGRRVWWRAHLTRRGRSTVGPARSFKVLPRPGSHDPARIAIGACASQFGPAFDALLARTPDVFVWQGDLNYPDTVGPLAQTMSGYAGIWRDFLTNPKLGPFFETALFAPQRDDHDYGVQDANSTNIVPWGLAPWEALMNPRLYYRFAAGAAEFWVLDQRRFKSDPAMPDTVEKTLLGADQREWLVRTLAASKATFKVICSPCTLAGVGANGRDGSWAKGFSKERDLLLQHIRANVSGQTLFVTGDTHWTMVYDRDGLFEVRPCPLGIPTPNDITLTSPTAAGDARKEPGVLYADQQYSHFAVVDVGGGSLDLTLVREDGAEVFRRRFG